MTKHIQISEGVVWYMQQKVVNCYIMALFRFSHRTHSFMMFIKKVETLDPFLLTILSQSKLVLTLLPTPLNRF